MKIGRALFVAAAVGLVLVFAPYYLQHVIYDREATYAITGAYYNPTKGNLIFMLNDGYKARAFSVTPPRDRGFFDQFSRLASPKVRWSKGRVFYERHFPYFNEKDRLPHEELAIQCELNEPLRSQHKEIYPLQGVKDFFRYKTGDFVSPDVCTNLAGYVVLPVDVWETFTFKQFVVKGHIGGP